MSKIFFYCLVLLGINKISFMYIGDLVVVGLDIVYMFLFNNIVNFLFYYVGFMGIFVVGKVVNYLVGMFSIDIFG